MASGDENSKNIYLGDPIYDEHSFEDRMFTYTVIKKGKLDTDDLIDFLESNDSEKKRLLYVSIIDIIIRNDFEALRFILENGYRLQVINDEGQTALHLAFYHNSHAIFTLLEKDDFCKLIDQDYTDCNGLTHFHIACAKGRTPLVKKFLEYTPDINACFHTDFDIYFNGFTPVHFAVVNCTRHREEILKLLIEKGADVHATDALGRTALHWACQIFDHPRAAPRFDMSLKVMQLLVKKYHSFINAKDAHNNTPLLLIFPKKYNEFETYYLRDRHHESEYIDETQAKLDFLLKYGADVTVINKDGNNALHLILSILRRLRYKPSSHLRSHMDLLEEGDKVFIEFSHFDNHYENMIEKILKCKPRINVNAENSSGQTPLKLAVACMNINIVKMLLKYRADISSLKFDEENFFCYLNIVPNYDVVKNLLNILELLEANGFDITLEDNLQVLKFVIHSHTDCDCHKIYNGRRQVTMNNLLCYGSPKHIMYILQKLRDTEKLEQNRFSRYYFAVNHMKDYLDCNKITKININKDVKSLIFKLIKEEESVVEWKFNKYIQEEAPEVESTVFTENLKLIDVLVMDPENIPYHIVNKYFNAELVHRFFFCKTPIKGHMAKTIIRYYIMKSAEEYFKLLLGFSLPQLLYRKIVYFLDNEEILNMCVAAMTTNDNKQP